MSFIDHISLVDIKDKRILLVLNKGKTKWQLPGGKREVGETDKLTLARECKEELGIELIPGTIEYLETVEGQASEKEKGMVIRIKIYTARFLGIITPMAEVNKAGYLFFSEVPDTSEIGWKYLTKLKQDGLIE